MKVFILWTCFLVRDMAIIPTLQSSHRNSHSISPVLRMQLILRVLCISPFYLPQLNGWLKKWQFFCIWKHSYWRGWNSGNRQKWGRDKSLIGKDQSAAELFSKPEICKSLMRHCEGLWLPVPSKQAQTPNLRERRRRVQLITGCGRHIQEPSICYGIRSFQHLMGKGF